MSAFVYINKVSPKLGGGAELRLREIGKRLVAKGHQVHVICAKTEAGLPDYEAVEGIQVHYQKTIPECLFRFKRVSFYLSRYLFYVGSYWNIRRVARQADVIIDDISPAPSFAFFIARGYHRPVCATVHEFFGANWFRLKDPLTASLGFVSQYSLKLFKFDSVITVSQFTKKRLVDFGVEPERIAVVPNGIDLSRIPQRDRSIAQPNSLVCLGRLVRQKGHAHLIEAMDVVAREVPDARLTIIGDGPLRDSLESKVRQRHLERNICFLGRVSEEEKFNVLWSSQIFIVPSLQEGFGIVVLEGMACGLPIVANDLPVFREILVDGEHGHLVDVKDPQRFGNKIVELMKDESRRVEIGQRNRAYVKQFNWDEIADQEEQVLTGRLSTQGALCG